MRTCNVPGCPSLTDESKCAKHRKAKRRESAAARRDTPEQQMYAGIGPGGRAWRRVRAEYVSRHPICEYEGGCIEPTRHVHHLDGDPLGPHGLDPAGLQGLCLRHHSQETARVQPGGWNAR